MTQNGREKVVDGSPGEPRGSGPVGAASSPVFNEQHAKKIEEIVGGFVHNQTTLRSKLFMQLMGDNRRSIDDECGYPNTAELDCYFYRDLYDREPLATRVVQVLPKESWQVSPSVYEDEDETKTTPFEEAWLELSLSLRGTSWFKQELGSPIWDHLLRADILSGIGSFGCLLIGIDDGKRLDEPIDGLVTVNYRNEPVYKDVPVREKDGHVVKNAEGRCRTRKVQVGTRRVKVDETPVMSDSPITNAQCDLLLNDATWTSRKRKLPPLSDEERGLVGSWTQNAKDAKGHGSDKRLGQQINEHFGHLLGGHGADQRAYIHKIEHEDKLVHVQPLHIAGATPDDRKASQNNVGMTRAAAEAFEAANDGWNVVVRDPQATHNRGRRPVENRIVSDAKELPRSPQDMYSGDLDYMLGAGTDQQYFGVQGGTSEQLSDKPGKKERKLLFLRAFDETLIQIVRWEWNPRNSRFGMPVMYRITVNDPRENQSGIGLPTATVMVHWSRVIHIADNRGSSESIGVPRMRSVLNPILDARKVRGAGAEGYWKSCFTGLQFSTHPQLGGDVDLNEQEVKDAYERYINGLQRGLIAKGGEWKTIAPSVVDPTPQRLGCIEDICIQIPCPKRVFMGTERGELASTQDDSQWNDVLRNRQNGYVTPCIICPLVDRLISVGCLPEPGEDGYSVEWADLESLSDLDKANIALILTQAIAAYVAGNVEALLEPVNYMCEVLGWEKGRVESMLEAAAAAQEEKLAEQQALADEHGMIPEPPPGFQHDEPVEPPTPIKVKEGEKLVDPTTVVANLAAEYGLTERETEQLLLIANAEQPRDEQGQFAATVGEHVDKLKKLHDASVEGPAEGHEDVMRGLHELDLHTLRHVAHGFDIGKATGNKPLADPLKYIEKTKSKVVKQIETKIQATYKAKQANSI